jgi:hypothetical protein
LAVRYGVRDDGTGASVGVATSRHTMSPRQVTVMVPFIELWILHTKS